MECGDTILGPSLNSVPEQLCEMNRLLSPPSPPPPTTVAFSALTPGCGGD